MFPSTGTLYLAPFSDESLFQVCLKNDLVSSLIYFTSSNICHISLSSFLSPGLVQEWGGVQLNLSQLLPTISQN